MKRMISFILMTITVVLFAAGNNAEKKDGGRMAPRLLNYQGYLTDTLGNPVTNPSVSMTFSIYDAVSSGNLKWTETIASVGVDKGIFHVLLGGVSSIPDSVFKTGADRWLEMSVAGQTLSPRTRIVSVPYAYAASYSDTALFAYGSTPDSKWNFLVSDGADTTLRMGSRWGLARFGNTLYGNADSTHVNLGVGCVTGANGQNYKYNTVGGGYNNTAVMSYSTVGGGVQNNAGGQCATVNGGSTNVATSECATVAGGNVNTASNYNATVSGGQGNIASGYIATVGGGKVNRARGAYSVISGGGGPNDADSNSAIGDYSSIGGGLANIARGANAVIGGGVFNRANGNDATVAGGTNNNASGYRATIGGGNTNTASNSYTSIGGGSTNVASGWCATVGGGDANTANQSWSTVGGGRFNKARGLNSVVSGGGSATEADSNSAIGDYSAIGGGRTNTAIGYAAIVAGGANDRATGNYSTVAGGTGNIASGSYSTVSGGINNTASGHLSAVSGGQNNTTSDSFNFIGAGYLNSTTGKYSVILGGYADTIFSGANYSYLFGINSNLTQDSTFMVDLPHVWFGTEANGYKFPYGRGTNGQALVTNGSGQVSWASTNDNDWVINGSDMYSAASGNVGVGVAAPAAKLDVAGSVKIADGTQALGRVFTSDASGLGSWQALPAAPVTSVFGRTGAVVAASGDYTTTLVTEGTNLYFTDVRAQAAITGGASSITSSNLTVNRALLSDGSGKVAVSTVTNTELGYLSGVTSAIQTQLSGKAPTASPTFTGNVTMPGTGIWNSSGNVGIGTTVPLRKLSVEGADNIPALSVRGSSLNNNEWTGIELGGNQGYGAKSGILWERTASYERGTIHFANRSDAATGDVGISDSKMVIDYSGNVGIGLTSPSTKLDVAGTVKIADGTQALGRVFTSDASGLGSWQAIPNDNDWIILVTDGADTTLRMGSRWGLARFGNTLYGNADSTHVNLGVNSTTGTNGQDYKYCTVGGGLSNQAGNNYATVAGGYANNASAERSAILGGYGNTASDNYAAVGGGEFNNASGFLSFVGGGYGNTASGDQSIIAGGQYNAASGMFSAVGGGYADTVTGFYSAIAGGYVSKITGTNSFIGSGHRNYIASQYSAIPGGWADSIFSNAHYSYLFGINSNLTQDSTFMVDLPHVWFGTEAGGYEFPYGRGTNGQVMVTDGSGKLSWSTAGDNDWIFLVSDGADTTLQTGGRWGLVRYGNLMYGNADSTHVNLGVYGTTGTNGQNYKYCAIGGGRYNVASNTASTVAGGWGNWATGYAAIVSGGESNAASGSRSFVGGGSYNKARGQLSVVSGGGSTTEADSNSAIGNYSTIGGGYHNIASGNSTVIGGGYFNAASNWYAVVGGGQNNTASGQYTTVGGGEANIASGHRATVAGGAVNYAAGEYSAILGGYADTVTATGDYSYLFGINSNLTQDSTFMVDLPHVWFGTESGGYEFPYGRGTNGQVMVTDGSGKLSWGSPTDADWTISGSNMYSAVSGNVGIGASSPAVRLEVRAGTSDTAAIFRGNLVIQSKATGNAVLELGEGLDYAEGFDVSQPEKIKAGTVLVIDPKNPGKLAVSHRAYDTKVAGIVAGGNGLASGVRLGTGDFDHNVALAGRVYCNVDASLAAIEPGDLLTTADTPGYAMKAQNYDRAKGAVLGKAMEPLAKGQKGQILVLVSLQ